MKKAFKMKLFGDAGLRLFLFLLLIGFLVSKGSLGSLVRQSLVDAYLSVAVFVAFTLCLIYGLEKFFRFNVGEFNRQHPHIQVYVSAVLGGLPGCGGALMVLTQFVRGQVSFGAVVATLTSTMGDAAFLLLAKEPLTGLFVMGGSIVVGSLMGTLVDWIHGKDFLQTKTFTQERKNAVGAVEAEEKLGQSLSFHFWQRFFKFLWFLILVPGMFMGFAQAFRVDLNVFFGLEFPFPIEWVIGLTGAVVSLFLWTIHSTDTELPFSLKNKDLENQRKRALKLRIVQETVPITAAVFLAFLLYEVTVFVFQIDLKEVFTMAGWTLPLMGILVGFIPGCGPQILVTTLYLNGTLPFSVQLANAISNDGDALFPAIVTAPKAAILGTLYSSLPAFILGYAHWFWIEL